MSCHVLVSQTQDTIGFSNIEFPSPIALNILQVGSNGSPGLPGRAAEFQTSLTHLQWRLVGDATWIDLLLLSTLTGPQGIQGIQGISGINGTNGTNGVNGTNGTNGKEAEFRINANMLQWKYTVDSIWIDLILLNTGSTVWGGITGTLSNQTDLQSALDSKASTSHSHSDATTSTSGFMSGVDKTKLNGIALGATANSPDATLLARANHTGTQVAATISDFSTQATVAARAATFTTTENGSVPAPITSTGKYLKDDGTWGVVAGGSGTWGAITGTLSNQTDLQTALNGKENTGTSATAISNHELAADPHSQYLTTAEGNANYATSGHTHTIANVSGLQTALDGKQAVGSYAATSHTHAQADVTGLVTALAGKEPNITAGTTAQYYRGDKSFVTLDKSAVGLPNVDNTSDANKPISSATQTALNGKSDTGHSHIPGDITGLTESIQDTVGAFLVQGANVTLTYDDNANTLTIAATGGSGSAAWGGITGTLSAQTDLQNALNDKINSAGALSAVAADVAINGLVVGNTLPATPPANKITIYGESDLRLLEKVCSIDEFGNSTRYMEDLIETNIAYWTPGTASGINTSGTGANVTVTNTNRYTRRRKNTWQNVATTQNQTLGLASLPIVYGTLGWYYRAIFGLQAFPAGCRLYAGIGNAVMVTSDTPAVAVQGIGFYNRTIDNDTTLILYTCDGTNQTLTPITVPTIATGNAYELEILHLTGATSISYVLKNYITNTVIVSGAVTDTLPSAVNNMTAYCQASNGIANITAASVLISCAGLVVKSLST